jgi:hypothetical protein
MSKPILKLRLDAIPCAAEHRCYRSFKTWVIVRFVMLIDETCVASETESASAAMAFLGVLMP